jgi:hypothetical protein
MGEDSLLERVTAAAEERKLSQNTRTGAPGLGGGGSPGIELLLHMPRNVFRHLEHGNLLLASKNSFEGIVSVDQRFFLRIL